VGAAWSVAFSPDGKVLAAGFHDGSVSLWDVTSGWQVGALPRQGGPVRWLGFHPDGRSLAVAGQWKDNHVLIYDLATGKETHRLVGHESGVLSGGWRADGKLLVTVGEGDGTVRVWNMSVTPPLGRAIRVLPPSRQWLHGVALTPEGRYAAVAAPDGKIPVLRLPDLPTPYDPGPARPTPDPNELASRPAAADALKRADVPTGLLKLAGNGDPARVPPEVVAVLGDPRFRLPTGDNSAITTDREGKWLAVANRDTVAVFDARTGELVRTLTGHNGRVNAIAFSPDAKFLAGGNCNGDHTMKVWDLKTGDVTATLKGHAGHIWSVVYGPDGTRLVSAGDDAVKVWDLKTGEVSRTLEAKAIGFFQIGLSPDGKKIVCGDTPSKTARVFDADTGELLATLRGFAAQINNAAFSADGQLLATGSHTECLVWSADKLELVKRVASPAGWLAFDPDGKTLLTANIDQNGPDRNHIVTRWDLKTFEGKPLPSLGKRLGWTKFQLSADGKTLYSNVGFGRDREQVVRVYDAATAKELFPRQGHTEQVWAVAFSPDGKRLASVSNDPGVYLWDMATGKLDRVLANEQGFWSVAFSPDGKRIAAGDSEGTVILHDAATGEKLQSVAGPKSQVRAVAFSPDGRLVAGTTFHGVVNVWEVASGRLRHTLAGRGLHSWNVAFSPDGKTLATGWSGGEVILYDTAVGWEVSSFRVGFPDVHWLGFHPDGRPLGIVGTGTGANLGVWDLATHKEIRRMTVPGNGGLGGAWRADGMLMATCSGSEGTVHLWSTDKPERDQVIRLYPPKTDWLHGLAMSPEGRHLAVACPDGIVTILRLAEPGEVFEVIDRERRAAEWVLSVDGRLAALHNGQTTKPEAASALPKGPFTVTEVTLDGCEKVTDEGVKFLAGLEALRRLNLEHTPVTDAGLKHLARLSSLSELNLDGVRITDAGLSLLGNLKGLKLLYLSKASCTPEGVAKLQQALPECKIVVK
jgi:WD40 repeat protein